MTDFTNDTAIPRKRASHAPMREYYVYFAVIFIATLPLAVLTWTLTAARQLALPSQGPVKSAWSQAQIITPRIFSA
ncbi:cytochrome PufQ [Sulfitobacter sp. S190]|uniref:cytochrome PufQ n=1 Tax=Sulfitobacter sp. S190 TaxID=2867022 RepID=UPI0021A50064|nr:cytochrome PufQ [Sulfitobacter sp. S190]UWR24360.1 protein pufQ [Sulfitobacter sp. S190]